MNDTDRELAALTSQLQTTRVDEQGLSFAGRSLKLNNVNDGKLRTYDMLFSCMSV